MQTLLIPPQDEIHPAGPTPVISLRSDEGIIIFRDTRMIDEGGERHQKQGSVFKDSIPLPHPPPRSLLFQSAERSLHLRTQTSSPSVEEGDPEEGDEERMGRKEMLLSFLFATSREALQRFLFLTDFQFNK
ncbi:hypothetical protein CDAR_487871 [Caerostris darwini]|uniref:Uncharacterized protein n=1 Tax=Caerostris darwini TaxID=1538125 RepID=A0AAV4TYQ2_9ARAC|nr:hypothetical protein CDAR_487871 [Caerostris darwini]